MNRQGHVCHWFANKAKETTPQWMMINYASILMINIFWLFVCIEMRKIEHTSFNPPWDSPPWECMDHTVYRFFGGKTNRTLKIEFDQWFEPLAKRNRTYFLCHIRRKTTELKSQLIFEFFFQFFRIIKKYN